MARATIHIEMQDGETLAGAINQLFGAKAPERPPVPLTGSKADPSRTASGAAVGGDENMMTATEAAKAAEDKTEAPKKPGRKPREAKGEQKPEAPAGKPVPEPELPPGGKVEPVSAEGEAKEELTVETVRALLREVSSQTNLTKARAIFGSFTQENGEPVTKVSEVQPADYANFAAKCRAALAEQAS